MAYWIKMNYERETYLVDLDSVSAFASGFNKRIAFWLPANGKQMIINHQINPKPITQRTIGLKFFMIVMNILLT